LRWKDADEVTEFFCGVCDNVIDFDPLMKHEHRKVTQVEQRGLPIKPKLGPRCEGAPRNSLHVLQLPWLLRDPDVRTRRGRRHAAWASARSQPLPEELWNRVAAFVSAEHDGF
jgi:hypothetical protein